MTAGDDLNQRVQIAQDRIVETAPPEARTGERDSVPVRVRKKVRFVECCYKFTEHQQQFEQQFQFQFQQQSDRDAG